MPRNRGKNTTLLASMTAEGMGPPRLAVVGSATKAVFEAYAEASALPDPERGTGSGCGQPCGSQRGAG